MLRATGADGGRERAIKVGDEFVIVPMLAKRLGRWLVTPAHDHSRIRITAVPGGRRRVFSYVKVDPQPMGNGRPDRGTHTDDGSMFGRHYLPADEAGLPAECEACGAEFVPTIRDESIRLSCRSCGTTTAYTFGDERWKAMPS